jgi:UDP-GlcNAc:undecaprenyl-phosphate GlcNAc-1-phosphate transferase
MDTVIILAAAGLGAFALNLAITPAIIRVAHRRKWYDLPNWRKIHTSPIPRLGGIGISVSFLAAILIVPIIVALIHVEGQEFPFQPRHLFVLAAFALTGAIGLVDDFRSLRARLKLILQIISAVLVTLGGFTISAIQIQGIGTLDFGFMAYPLTVFWIVGLSNALNFVDGIDGFAGGISGFASLSLGVILLLQGHDLGALVSFALLGSTLAFLFFNLPPARIFMGDSGAYILGFTLSVLPILGLSKVDALGNLAATSMVLVIPIIDTATAIVRRVCRKQSIGSPDKEHIHHKLLDLGLKDTAILRIVYLYSLVLAASSVVTAVVQNSVSFAVFAIVWIGSIVLYLRLARIRERQKTGS